jgi:hypothetical protein
MARIRVPREPSNQLITPLEVVDMGRLEYKVEQVHWTDDLESRNDQLIEQLNAFAKQGWRVVSVDLTVHASFEAKPLPVLLVREVNEPI